MLDNVTTVILLQHRDRCSTMLMLCGERKSNGSGPPISLTIDDRKSKKASTFILD
jgi:hypothetical protein